MGDLLTWELIVDCEVDLKLLSADDRYENPPFFFTILIGKPGIFHIWLGHDMFTIIEHIQ